MSYLRNDSYATQNQRINQQGAPMPRDMQTPPMQQPFDPATEVPMTVQNPYYAAGFLKNYIGRLMRVEFMLGTSGNLTDRIGTLREVGASYIVLQPFNTDDILMADLYSIKFVTIY